MTAHSPWALQATVVYAQARVHPVPHTWAGGGHLSDHFCPLCTFALFSSPTEPQIGPPQDLPPLLCSGQPRPSATPNLLPANLVRGGHRSTDQMIWRGLSPGPDISPLVRPDSRSLPESGLLAPGDLPSHHRSSCSLRSSLLWRRESRGLATPGKAPGPTG